MREAFPNPLLHNPQMQSFLRLLRILASVRFCPPFVSIACLSWVPRAHRNILQRGNLEELTRQKIKDELVASHGFSEETLVDYKDYFKRVIDEEINS